MPPPRYWFTPTTVLPIVGSVFGIAVGLIGARPLITEWGSDVLIWGAVLASLAAWYAAAKAAQDAAEQRQLLNTIHASTVGSLVGTSVEDLSKLNGTALRQRVHTLTERMRAFDRGRRESTAVPAPTAMATVEQSRARFEEYTAEISRRHREAQSDFHAQFLPLAVALKAEMLRRLGLTEPAPKQYSAVALDYGMLAGVAPVSEAAAVLQALARRLPP